MTLDQIEAGTFVTMTDGLKRLFEAAGCSPTRCHACERLIAVGRQFRLQTHTKPGATSATDEMVCDRCDDKALDGRDKRLEKRNQAFQPERGYRTFKQNNLGGYSRPSKGSES